VLAATVISLLAVTLLLKELLLSVTYKHYGRHLGWEKSSQQKAYKM